MTARIPLGISDFREIRDGGFFYVDKSPLIGEILDAGAKVILLPRPRRFGKTLQLSMLRYFFADPADRDLFEGLAIAGTEHMAQQGTRPCIHLSLKDIKERDFASFLDRAASVLAQLFQEWESELDRVKPIFRKTVLAIANEEATPRQLSEGLAHAAKMVAQLTGKKVVILIDEYDTPLHAAFTHGYYHEAVSFMRAFLGAALKDNPHLERGILTGILRVAKESIFSGLNNLQVFSVLHNRFAEYFGFTETEVQAMLDHFGLTEHLSRVRDWYNGYHIGGTVVYNPWAS